MSRAAGIAALLFSCAAGQITDTLPRSRPPDPIAHGPRTQKRIALTFDACATSRPSRYDERITQILVKTQTPATLFLGGKWMQDHRAATRYLASLPQIELANHTYLHPHLPQLDDEQIRNELATTQLIMDSLTGRAATYFRPPYGEYDERVVRIATELGLTTIQYDLASGDPDTAATKERLIEYVVGCAKNGSIIVMHINRRGWHTAEALPEIIRGLLRRGFTLVTVSNLLQGAEKPER
jgi:peptidoglycan/xylan/chitin deacetylase (PgdA/CDA1 family)